MGETRRMHYVPKTYLKHFAREDLTKGDAQFFINAMDTETARIKEINILNVCIDKDIYRLHRDTEEERQFLEKMYQLMFEDGYSHLYNILTNDKHFFITPSERSDIISFVVSMFYRNKVWNDIYYDFMDGIYETGYNYSREKGLDSFTIEGEEISITGYSLEELKKAYRKKERPRNALVSAQKLLELARLRRTLDVIFVTKLDGDQEFITSDHPVVCRNEPGVQVIPMDPTNRLALAINNKYMVELQSIDDHEINKLMIGRMPPYATMGSIISSAHNNWQIQQSDKFLFGSCLALGKIKLSEN